MVWSGLNHEIFSIVRIYVLLSLLQLSYLISAWARMCKILGERFKEYLPLVMPPVLKVACIKPEVALLDGQYILLFALLHCSDS